MSKYESKSIRNLAIIGHGGTGKTSLCESFLFVAGKTERQGRVDDGTSTMDYEPEEQKRHISISAATNFIDWEKHRVNIIDTPGDSNFTFDTKSCLRIVDGAVVLVDAVGGVEFQTEKVWEYTDEYRLPRLIFISRMDRERADFTMATDSVRTRLGKKITVFTLPIGAAESFSGVVDLISMKAFAFDDQKKATKTVDIPAGMADEVKKYHDILIEDIAETDDELMNKYLESGELTPEDLQTGLRKGVVAGSIIPVVCGSATKNIGIIPLIDTIVRYFPSPVDQVEVVGIKPEQTK